MSQLCFANSGRIGSAFRQGLTLLELVVVLGILAVLSTVAVRSLQPVADQARYEVTQKVLNDLWQAALGGPSPGNAAPATQGGYTRSGFITDTGSLPTDVNELLVCPAGLIDRTLQTFDSDRDSVDDVSLVSGWNGPYLHLGAGATSVMDGWGNEPLLTIDSGELELRSFGSDGNSLPPEDGYRKDIVLHIGPADYLGTIVFRIFAIDPMNGSRIDPAPSGTEQLGVLFYGVNAMGGSSGAVEEQLIVIDNAGSFEFRREDTLAGTVAARAILWNDTNSNQILDPGETIILKSLVHYATLEPRVDTRVEMELR